MGNMLGFRSDGSTFEVPIPATEDERSEMEQRDVARMKAIEDLKRHMNDFDMAICELAADLVVAITRVIERMVKWQTYS